VESVWRPRSSRRLKLRRSFVRSFLTCRSLFAQHTLPPRIISFDLLPLPGLMMISAEGNKLIV
jgi:hypothetical protein